MFLKEKDGRITGEDYQYDAVNNGCSTKIYPIEGAIVVFGDERISMEKFIGELNKTLKKE